MLLVLEASASAQELPERLAVSVPVCEPEAFGWASLAAQLEVELRGSEVRLAEPAALRVVFQECPEDEEVDVLLVTDERRSEATLRLDVWTPRALALALVELVRGRWSAMQVPEPDPADALRARIDALEARALEAEEAREGESRRLTAAMAATMREHAALEAEVATTEATRREESNERSAAPPVMLGAAAAVTLFPSNAVSLFGGGAEVDAPVGPLRLVARVGAGAAREEVDLGHVRLRVVDGSLSLLSPYTPGRVRVALGASFALGWLRARGVSEAPMTRAMSADDVLAWAALELRVMASLGDVVVVANVVAGHTVIAFDGVSDAAPVLSVRGAVLGLRMGVAFGVAGGRR